MDDGFVTALRNGKEEICVFECEPLQYGKECREYRLTRCNKEEGCELDAGHVGKCNVVVTEAQRNFRSGRSRKRQRA